MKAKDYLQEKAGKAKIEIDGILSMLETCQHEVTEDEAKNIEMSLQYAEEYLRRFRNNLES